MEKIGCQSERRSVTEIYKRKARAHGNRLRADIKATEVIKGKKVHRYAKDDARVNKPIKQQAERTGNETLSNI